jgi:glyceraldehyde 3-phosphate dehydrogenase
MRIGISGLGRVGRALLRRLVLDGREVVALQEPGLPAEALVRLLRRDSVHGPTPFEVRLDGERLWIAGYPCRLVGPKVPFEAPVDLVVESSGRTDHALSAKALGGPRVLLTRLSSVADLTVFLGANDASPDALRAARVTSAGSCTGNALLPVLRALDTHALLPDRCAVTVLHPFLATQNLLDNPSCHEEPSFSRAAPLSLMPARTRLPEAVELVFPGFGACFSARCVRVPTPAVLALDLVLVYDEPMPGARISGALRQAAAESHRGLIDVVEEPLVSCDFTGSPFSASVDPAALQDAPALLQRLLLWQDNEVGYAARVADLVARIEMALSA